MNNSFKLFGTIGKTEEQPDGSIKVYGVASSGARDQAGEIVKPEAMKAALPDYSKFPALREMHEPKAAGRVIEASVDDDGFTNIVAHVVDPIAVAKVKAQVYPAFSIGGRILERDAADKSVISALRLVEISLVDSPCNPDAALTMWKADQMSEYAPSGDEVVARAKKLAEAAGTKKFRDFLFEAREELVAEDMLAKGQIDEPPTVAEPVASAADLAAEDEAAKAAAVAAEAAPIVADPESPEPKEAAATPDAAATLAAALAEVTEKAKPDEAPAPTPSPLADLAKVAAALRTIKTEPPAGLDIVTAARFEKSLYTVGCLAQLMDRAVEIQSCTAFEAEYEGDGSKVPAMLAEACGQLGATLIAMAQEEVAEALQAITGDETIVIEYIGDDEPVLLAQQIVDLTKADETIMAKAGARHSKADKEHLQAAHDSLAKAGAVCDAGNCPDAAEKAAALEGENETLKKALADAAPQVLAFGETIDTLKAEIAELRKRFEDEPLPPKTAGPAVVRVVEKGADSSGGSAAPAAVTKEDFEKALAELPEGERGVFLIKFAHMFPQAIQAPLSAKAA